MICNYKGSTYKDQNPVPSLSRFSKLQAIYAMPRKRTRPKNATTSSNSSHPRPMQSTKQKIIHHIGIIPIPPPPDPPRNPPCLAGPPPKLLPLFLLLADLLFVTPAEAWPLPVLPDAFLDLFGPPRKLPRPLLPPRLFELSYDGARAGGGAGAS